MHILCPHCHNPIEVVKLNPREEIACPSCGSSFSVEPGSTTGWERPPGQKLGKYELIDTVGQGAFGTVYKARDPELDRVVAIKVPRAGNLAGPQELDRFLREARSVAQLRHPSIVTVHDVGQVEGVPYLVSDFVEGVTLSDLLSARRPGFREAAQLVAAVADALQYAHERGVVHRDVKPSNIMIGPDGAAFVMDFGLAKRDAGEITMTVEGQVLGTPAYMSPEQARGEGHAVDARGDVYSLGVVLYQLLTGELPFRGTTRMLLHQVLHDEPRRPRSLNDHIPRDLETIALKAMAKEAGRRYPTARELADDLRRWLKGEAILARPVGRLERAVRWTKRNPALAASLATIAGILVAATAISTGFGIDAHTKEVAAEAAKNDLAAKNTALERSQDKLEGALARTWLSPLAETSGPVSDAEIAAFTEVAANRNERLAERYVAEILRDRQSIRRVRAHSIFALHAAVGLDPQKRREVERQLVRALEVPDMAEDSRIDLALAAAALGELSPPNAALVVQLLVPALVNTNDLTARKSLAQGLSAVLDRMEAKEAGEAAATLTQTMSGTTDAMALRFLAQGLSAASGRLEAKESARVSAEAAALLTQTMSRTTEAPALQALTQGLSAVAGRLETKEASKAAATLTQAMSRTNNASALYHLAEGLAAVSGRLEPKDAGEVAATLIQAMSKATDASALPALARSLSAVSGRLEPKDAGEAAVTLAQAMSKTTDASALNSLAQGLSAVAGRLGPKDAGAAAATLTEAISRTNNASGLYYLGEGLSAVAGRLEAKDAGETAATLTQAMSKTMDSSALNSLAQGLSAVATNLEPKDAGAAAAMLTQAISKMNNANAIPALARSLWAVSGRLEAKEAAHLSAKAAATLTQAMSRTTDAFTLHSLTQGLSAVAGRLEAKEAGEASVTLMQAMSKTNNAPALRFLAQGLSALAGRSEATEAARVCAEAAATLTQAMSQATDALTLNSLAQGLSAVAGRLEATEAARVCAEAAVTLTQAMSRTTDALTLQALAQSLSVLVGRLEATEAARLSARAAVTLTQAMSKTNSGNALQALAQGLSAVSGHLQAKEAGEAAATLTQAMSKTTDAFTLHALTQALSAVAAHLEPKEAATLHLRALAKITDTWTPVPLKHGLATALGDFHQDQRAQAIAAAVAGLRDNLDLPGTLLLLRPAAEPFPRHLSDQELVELLKHPLCVGDARRIVLDHLGTYHQRTFADQWEFVRFAEEQKLGLDFTTPPKRP